MLTIMLLNAGAGLREARTIYSGGAAHVVTVVGVIAVAGLVQTVRVLFRGATTQRTRLALLAAWTLLPPLWFWFEYFYLYKPFAPAGTFEAFKYGQDISAKIWAAIVAVITAVMLAKRKGS